VFRVFCTLHPNIAIIPVNCSLRVEKMIKHVMSTYTGKEKPRPNTA